MFSKFAVRASSRASISAMGQKSPTVPAIVEMLNAASASSAEDCEKSAKVAQVATEKKTEDLWDELKSGNSDFATVRTDFVTARAE